MEWKKARTMSSMTPKIEMQISMYKNKIDNLKPQQ